MTTSTPPLLRRRPTPPPETASATAFHPPPLRPVVIDIARDLAAVRQGRSLLTQRIGAVWIRGHAHG